MSHGGARFARTRWIAPRTPETPRARVVGDGTWCMIGSGDEDDEHDGSGGGERDNDGGGVDDAGGGETVRGERSSKLLLVNVSRSRTRRILSVCKLNGAFFGPLCLGLEARAEFGGS